MTRAELEGHVTDVLKVAPLSTGQTVAQVLSRVNGANLQDLLAATLSVAREQTCQIAELENTIRDVERERGWLEDDIQELRDRLESLRKDLRAQLEAGGES